MSNTGYLKAIEYYLPEITLSNEQINIEHPEWTADKISSKTGIFNRHLSNENEFSSDLGLKATKRLFDAHPTIKNKIDYLIFCTQSPDYLIPTTACILQDKLGLNKNIGAIDINMGCSGFIYGLSYANGLISSGQAENVLLITAETYSKYIHKLDKNNKTIFGDGASASLVSKHLDEQLSGAIGKFSFYTDGSGFVKLIVKNSGIRYRNIEANEELNADGTLIKSDKNLFMDGRAVFEFTSFEVPPMVESVLEKNKLQLEDIDLFIFHQANAFMMQYMRKRCKIPEEKFFIFLEDCANTVSSTIPIALLEAQKQNKISKNKKVLLAGFGVGLSIAGTIIDY